ncbi:MAG: type I-E CRISPR-associated protein Cas6/Cse3/CasE [Thermomicrobiales bacterium]|nr:type I-E CRISPR-associated protein Cas6/Cse3/CasE [Thermomicrobiales bacterium]
MSELLLSRWSFDPRQRAVQRALGDSQALHRLVMSAFPPAATGEEARQAFGVLYRVDIDEKTGVPALLVQSRVRPDVTPLTPLLLRHAGEVKNVAPLYEALAVGAVLRFRLRANPVRRVHTNHTDDKLAGKRVNLRTDEQRREWIAEKLAREAGCLLGACAMREGGAQRGQRGAQRLSHGAVTYDGLLRVVDADALRAGIRAGIGPGKAYGFGLLSVAPAER